jgi:hypothetical protein
VLHLFPNKVRILSLTLSNNQVDNVTNLQTFRRKQMMIKSLKVLQAVEEMYEGIVNFET